MSDRIPVPPARRLFRRSIIALMVATIGLLSVAPGSALAENSVASSNPEDGSSIESSPEQIEIVFNDELGEVNTIAVECNTELFTLGRPERSDDNLTLTAEVIDALPAGTCVVRWGVSDGEGQPNGVGNLTFNVQNDPAITTTTVHDGDTTTVAPDATTVETSATTVPADTSTTDSEGSTTSAADDVANLSSIDTGQGPLWLGRFISVLGIAILFGSLIVIAAAWPEGVEYLLAVRFIRASWLLALVGTVLYVSAAAAAVTDQSLAASFSPTAWLDLLNAGVPGIAALARLVLVLASAWIAFRPDRAIDPATQLAALGIPALSVVTIGFSRTDADFAVLSVAVGIGHALAMAVWFGGITLLARVVLAGPGEEDLVHAVRGFGRLSRLAIVATVATGIVQMVLLDGGDLFSSSHGRVVLLKSAVVAGMVFIAMTASKLVAQRLTRAHEMSVSMANRLRRAFGIEAAAGVVVLAMSAWLLTLAPPNISAGADIDYAIERQVEVATVDLDVTVKISRDTVGLAGLSIEVDSPESGLSGLEIVLTAPANETIGTITQPVPLTGPGVAVLPDEDGVPLTVAGDWALTVNAVINGGVVNTDPQVFTIKNADGSAPTTVITIVGSTIPVPATSTTVAE